MQEQQSLHKLYKYFPHDVYIEPLIVLCFDVAVDVHAQHFSHDTLP